MHRVILIFSSLASSLTVLGYHQEATEGNNEDCGLSNRVGISSSLDHVTSRFQASVFSLCKAGG